MPRRSTRLLNIRLEFQNRQERYAKMQRHLKCRVGTPIKNVSPVKSPRKMDQFSLQRDVSSFDRVHGVSLGWTNCSGCQSQHSAIRCKESPQTNVNNNVKCRKNTAAWTIKNSVGVTGLFESITNLSSHRKENLTSHLSRRRTSVKRKITPCKIVAPTTVSCSTRNSPVADILSSGCDSCPGLKSPVVVLTRLPSYCQLGSPVNVSSLSRMETLDSAQSQRVSLPYPSPSLDQIADISCSHFQSVTHQDDRSSLVLSRTSVSQDFAYNTKKNFYPVKPVPDGTDVCKPTPRVDTSSIQSSTDTSSLTTLEVAANNSDDNSTSGNLLEMCAKMAQIHPENQEDLLDNMHCYDLYNYNNIDLDTELCLQSTNDKPCPQAVSVSTDLERTGSETERAVKSLLGQRVQTSSWMDNMPADLSFNTAALLSAKDVLPAATRHWEPAPPGLQLLGECTPSGCQTAAPAPVEHDKCNKASQPKRGRTRKYHSPTGNQGPSKKLPGFRKSMNKLTGSDVHLNTKKVQPPSRRNRITDYKCNRCCFYAKDKQDRKAHNKQFHPRCSLCGRVFSCQEALASHRSYCVEINCEHCQVCDKLYLKKKRGNHFHTRLHTQLVRVARDVADTIRHGDINSYLSSVTCNPLSECQHCHPAWIHLEKDMGEDFTESMVVVQEDQSNVPYQQEVSVAESFQSDSTRVVRLDSPSSYPMFTSYLPSDGQMSRSPLPLQIVSIDDLCPVEEQAFCTGIAGDPEASHTKETSAIAGNSPCHLIAACDTQNQAAMAFKTSFAPEQTDTDNKEKGSSPQGYYFMASTDVRSQHSSGDVATFIDLLNLFDYCDLDQFDLMASDLPDETIAGLELMDICKEDTLAQDVGDLVDEVALEQTQDLDIPPPGQSVAEVSGDQQKAFAEMIPSATTEMLDAVNSAHAVGKRSENYCDMTPPRTDPVDLSPPTFSGLFDSPVTNLHLGKAPGIQPCSKHVSFHGSLNLSTLSVSDLCTAGFSAGALCKDTAPSTQNPPEGVVLSSSQTCNIPTSDSLLDATPTLDSLLHVTPSKDSLFSATPVTDSLLDVTSSMDSLLDMTPTSDSLLDLTPTSDSLLDVTPSKDSLFSATPVTDSLLDVTSSMDSLLDMTPTSDSLLDVTPCKDSLLSLTSTADSLFIATPVGDSMLDANPTTDSLMMETPTTDSQMMETPTTDNLILSKDSLLDMTPRTDALFNLVPRTPAQLDLTSSLDISSDISVINSFPFDVSPEISLLCRTASKSIDDAPSMERLPHYLGQSCDMPVSEIVAQKPLIFSQEKLSIGKYFANSADYASGQQITANPPVETVMQTPLSCEAPTVTAGLRNLDAVANSKAERILCISSIEAGHTQAECKTVKLSAFKVKHGQCSRTTSLGGLFLRSATVRHPLRGTTSKLLTMADGSANSTPPEVVQKPTAGGKAKQKTVRTRTTKSKATSTPNVKRAGRSCVTGRRAIVSKPTVATVSLTSPTSMSSTVSYPTSKSAAEMSRTVGKGAVYSPYVHSPKFTPVATSSPKVKQTVVNMPTVQFLDWTTPTDKPIDVTTPHDVTTPTDKPIDVTTPHDVTTPTDKPIDVTTPTYKLIDVTTPHDVTTPTDKPIDVTTPHDVTTPTDKPIDVTTPHDVTTPTVIHTAKHSPTVHQTAENLPVVIQTVNGSPADSQTAKNSPAVIHSERYSPAESQTAKNSPVLIQSASYSPADSQTAKDSPAESQTAKDSLADSQTANNSPADGQTARNSPTDSQTARNSPVDSRTAKDILADSQTAKNSPADSPTARNSPTDSQTARNSPADSQTARNSPAESQTARNSPADSQTAKDIPADSYTAKNSPADSQTARNSPADSQTAKDIPADSQTAKDIPADSQTAKDIPADSQTAKNSPADSQTARNSPADSQTAKDIPADSQTAKNSPADSQTAKNSPADSQTAKDIPADSQTAKNSPADSQTAKNSPADSQTAKNSPAVIHSQTAKNSPAVIQTKKDSPIDSQAVTETVRCSPVDSRTVKNSLAVIHTKRHLPPDSPAAKNSRAVKQTTTPVGEKTTKTQPSKNDTVLAQPNTEPSHSEKVKVADCSQQCTLYTAGEQADSFKNNLHINDCTSLMSLVVKSSSPSISIARSSNRCRGRGIRGRGSGKQTERATSTRMNSTDDNLAGNRVATVTPNYRRAVSTSPAKRKATDRVECSQYLLQNSCDCATSYSRSAPTRHGPKVKRLSDCSKASPSGQISTKNPCHWQELNNTSFQVHKTAVPCSQRETGMKVWDQTCAKDQEIEGKDQLPTPVEDEEIDGTYQFLSPVKDQEADERAVLLSIPVKCRAMTCRDVILSTPVRERERKETMLSAGRKQKKMTKRDTLLSTPVKQVKINWRTLRNIILPTAGKCQKKNKSDVVLSTVEKRQKMKERGAALLASPSKLPTKDTADSLIVSAVMPKVKARTVLSCGLSSEEMDDTVPNLQVDSAQRQNAGHKTDRGVQTEGIGNQDVYLPAHSHTLQTGRSFQAAYRSCSNEDDLFAENGVGGNEAQSLQCTFRTGPLPVKSVNHCSVSYYAASCYDTRRYCPINHNPDNHYHANIYPTNYYPVSSCMFSDRNLAVTRHMPWGHLDSTAHAARSAGGTGYLGLLHHNSSFLTNRGSRTEPTDTDRTESSVYVNREERLSFTEREESMLPHTRTSRSAQMLSGQPLPAPIVDDRFNCRDCRTQSASSPPVRCTTAIIIGDSCL